MAEQRGHFTAQYWRARAEEARTRAEEMHEEGPRNSMLGIAAEYDWLAKKAEERERDEQHGR